MAEGLATRSSRGHRTICLPIAEEAYLQAIHDPVAFRRWIDDRFRETPELFPANFARGYELKDGRTSVKQGLPIRRLLTRDKAAYSVRPSFVLPYMTARTADVEGPVLGAGPRLRPRPDLLVSPGVRPGPVQRRGDHRPPGGPARASPGRRTPSDARRPEDLHRHDRRLRLPPGGRAGGDRRDRRPEGRLRGL
jgi:hypothetical protein